MWITINRIKKYKEDNLLLILSSTSNIEHFEITASSVFDSLKSYDTDDLPVTAAETTPTPPAVAPAAEAPAAAVGETRKWCNSNGRDKGRDICLGTGCRVSLLSIEKAVDRSDRGVVRDVYNTKWS